MGSDFDALSALFGCAMFLAGFIAGLYVLVGLLLTIASKARGEW